MDKVNHELLFCSSQQRWVQPKGLIPSLLPSSHSSKGAISFVFHPFITRMSQTAPVCCACLPAGSIPGGRSLTAVLFIPGVRSLRAVPYYTWGYVTHIPSCHFLRLLRGGQRPSPLPLPRLCRGGGGSGADQ